MDDYLLLELSSLKNSGDSDNDTRTRANRLMSLFKDDEPLRDWSFTDPLREGGANLVRSLSPSNMEIERLQGLIGLDDEAFTKKARSQYSLFDDTYMLRRRPQEERDEELRRRIASMSEGRERVNAIADAIAPTHHTQPDTWYGKLGYGALKLAPDIAASIPQIMALGPLGFAGLSTVRGHNASTEQVYDNLRRQGFSPDEAYEKANALLPNIGDLALRGGVNFATMGLLNKTPVTSLQRFPFAGSVSPYTQTAGNIAMASGVSGAGAMGEQALTNYRSGIDNDFTELGKTGLKAAAFTGAMGLINAGLNWRNLRELQRQYWENMNPVDATDWWPKPGDDGTAGTGTGRNPRPNDPNSGGDLPQLEVLTPEKAARLQKQAEILAKYNLPPETDLWKAIDNGSIPDDTAFNILVDLGANPDIARSLVEKTHQINDLMNRTNNLLRGTPKTKQSDTPRQPTEIIVPAKELRQDPLFTHPEPQGTQTPRPTAVKEPPASNPPSDMWSDPLKLGRVPPKQPTQPAPRLMALGANEAYYNNDPYSDSGGDNSHPEQDIPEPHTSDNVPANINALGRQEHSNSLPDVPRLTEEEKARIKKKYPEKADDLIAYLESSPSNEELAQYGFKYGENGKYVPIEQGQQTEQPQPAPKAPDINALGRQPEQPRDVIAESMNDVAQKNSERDISRGDSNTQQQVQHRDKPKKPDTQQTEFIKYSGSTPPSVRGKINMQNRKLLDTLISGMPDNMQEIRNKLSALNVPTLIGILGYKDSDAKKEHYINMIINSMNRKRSHNPEYFDVADNVITQAQEVSQNAPEAPQPQKAHEPATPSRTVDTQSDSPIVRIAQQVKELLTGKWRKISNQDLLDLAAHEFGGTKGEGVFKHRQAYDAMEMGINMAVERAKISPVSTKYTGIFESDIEKLLDILSRIPTQTNRDTEQVEYQQFSTPPTLAYLVNWLANISKNNTVLEPSAGTGNLAVFAHNAGAKLIMNDYSKSGLRADILDAFGWGKVYREDALYFGDILRNEVREGKRSESELPDRVIMNPPFSSAGKQGTANSNQNGFRHVEQALEALRDGGRLVAILGAGRDGTASSVKTWLKHIGKTYNVRALITSGGKAYQKYGTTFSNAIVVIDKTGATPKGSTKDFSFSGDFSNREEVRKLLETFSDIRNDTRGRDNEADTEKPEHKKNTKNVATLEDFKKAFDELDRGRIFVRIPDLRRKLGWPRDVFDNILKELRDMEIIQLHTGDASLMTPDEVADCFVDENNFRKGSVTWEGFGNNDDYEEPDSGSNPTKPEPPKPKPKTDTNSAGKTATVTQEAGKLQNIPDNVDYEERQNIITSNWDILLKAKNEQQMRTLLDPLDEKTLYSMAQRVAKTYTPIYNYLTYVDEKNLSTLIEEIIEEAMKMKNRIIPRNARFKSGKLNIPGVGEFSVSYNKHGPLLEIFNANTKFTEATYDPEYNELTPHPKISVDFPTLKKAFLEHITDFYEVPESTKKQSKPEPVAQKTKPDKDISSLIEKVKSAKNEEEIRDIFNSVDRHTGNSILADIAGSLYSQTYHITSDINKTEFINRAVNAVMWTLHNVPSSDELENASLFSLKNIARGLGIDIDSLVGNEDDTTQNRAKLRMAIKRASPQGDKKGTTQETTKQDNPTEITPQKEHKRAENDAQSKPEREVTPKSDISSITRKSSKEIREERKQQEDNSIQSSYSATVVTKGAKHHPADLVESTVMRSVALPDVKENPQISQSIIDEGRLSNAQMEAITLAINSFNHILPNGYRRGYFIGDGTGVGKGREISGIILDTLTRGAGKGKALWVSDKHSLIKDAVRDWQGIGQNPKDIFAQETFNAKQDIDKNKGILFTAYSHLASKFRIEQLKKWLGDSFDGIIVLDEAHNANNVLGEKPASRAINTLTFIRAFPKARVLYVSATGATELDNFAMLDRLGLWGYNGAPFESAQAFVNQLSKGGIAAMEVAARDLKAMGLFSARSLSMRAGPYGGKENVTFRTLEYQLNDEMKEIYDTLASIWQMIEQRMPAIMEARGYNAKDGRNIGRWKRYFWGAHQRFFNQIITAMQTDGVIRDMSKQLDAGNSIVIQLTNTMESSLDRAIQKGVNEEGEYDISPKDTLIQFVRDMFNPRAVEYVADEDGNEFVQDVFDSNGKPVLSQRVINMRDEMIKIIESINRFPDSPIDKILNFFGHENVAEITGRSKRPRTMIDKKTGKKTNLETGRTDKVKAGEIEDFNNGRRRILIFSEKGGTGASYHASNDVKNQQKRIHYLLQAGWRADKAIQGLGRSHRSNEAHKPEYVLVTTDIPGQKRFISTIARRLEQLGALSTGERRTTSGGLFSDSDNLESSYVTTALWKFFQKLKMPLESNAVPYPELNPEEVFRQLGFDMEKLEGIGVTDFLNRLLAMTVDTQKKVFSRFQQEINAVKEEYQANGIDIDAPTENVNALNIKILQEKRIFQSKEFETDTNYLQLEITRPMNPITWQEISGLIDAGVDFEFYTLQSGKIVAARKSPEKGFDPKTSQFFEQYTLIQPDRRKAEYGVRTEVLDNEDPKQRRQFTRIDAKTAQAIWNTQTDELPKTYTAIENLITGAMLPVWNLIEGHPKIWRVTTDDGREFLGRLIPEKQLQKVLRVCNVNYESNKKYDAETLKKDLDKRGMIATLLNKAKLKFSRVNGEKLLEIIPTDEWQARSLKRAGLISMIINSKERLFFPAGNDEMLNNYIKDNPLVGTPVQFDDADDILEEAADVINSSIDSSDSSHLHIIHPSFRGLFNWNQDDNPLVHKSPYASPNTEFEKRYQASKKTDEKKSILGHLKDFVLQVAKGRHDIPELAGDNWKKLFAVDDSLIDAQEIFREFKRERQANLHETEKILRAILLDIKKPDDFDLFERAMQLQDLNETRERDINARMPWGLNPDSLYDTYATDPLDEEYSRIMNHVSKNPRVQEAMQKADTLMNSLRNRLIKAAENLGMFDLRDRLNRKHYFRHLVLEYYNMQRSGQPHPIFKNPERRGYTAHRQGSDKDISSNWILAMGEVMIRMTDDIKILQTLAKLRKKYDIIETLKQQAFSDNKTRAVDEMMKDLEDVPEELRRGKAEEALEKKLHARQARAISRLFKLASEGDLPVGENHEWQEVVGRMADAGQLENLSREEQKNLSRYIGWLAGLKDKTDSRTAARSFLTGQKKQNSILKDILGEKYVDWKGAIPDDHTLWSPSDSRLVFSASTVPEYVLKLAMENIDDMLGVNVSDLGNAIATGGINQLWCIPAKLADALNNLGKSQPAGAFKKFMTSAMTGFKRWVTISPVEGRIVKYNYRNFFGDLEAVLQGNPGALYYFRQAAKELSNTMLKGGEATGLLAEFNKRGGGLTTEIMTELEHPERLKEFSRLFEQEKKHSILDSFRAYVEIMTRLTNFRESILRYASFLSFVRLIQENGGTPPFYGMSKPKEVLALKDNIYDMAFKLANENLGAYDQVSSNTQWLRDNNITSFLSWVEVNFTRSIQMYKNIWQGNSFLEYWIKKHGNDFIDMFAGGGAGHGNGNGGNNEPPKNNNGGDFPDDDGNGDNEFRKMFRKGAKKSGNVALRLGITLALAAPLYFMAKMWNKLMGADENDPNLDDRNGVSVYLGRNAFTGDNLYMSDIGATFDFFRTTGLHSIFGGDVRDLLDGRITFGQLITNMLDGPVTKLANNLNPYAKATVEAAFDKRLYPSALHPSPIRDKGKFVAQSFGLDWYYDWITDKPHKPFLDFASSIFNTAKQDQSAYFYIQGRKKQFQENVLGKYTDAFTMTRRGEALRNAKRAIDLGDKKSFRRFMREYSRAGGTEQGLKASARASDPFFGLNDEEELRFIKWLPKEERKILRRAIRYGERIKAYLEP